MEYKLSKSEFENIVNNNGKIKLELFIIEYI